MRERETDEELLDEYGLGGDAGASTSNGGESSLLLDADDVSPGASDLDDLAGLVKEMAEKSPAFAKLIAQKVPLSKTRNFSFSFPSLTGKKGQVLTTTLTPQVLFRGNKLVATDTASPPGSGTRISFLVGNRLQSLGTPRLGVSTMLIGALGGQPFDTCQPALNMVLQIEFLKDCTFEASILGQGVS